MRMVGSAMTRLAGTAMIALWLGACSGAGGQEGDATTTTTDEASGTDMGAGAFVSLIDQDAWMEVDAGQDPLADHRPEMVDCGLAGWTIENGESLEIDTNFCNYLALSQPSLAPIAAGATVELDFYYFDLTAPEPAEAHFAMLVDGQILWETTIAIPGKANVHSESFAAPFAAPEGAEVIIHLHNHGQNTWQFDGLRVWVPD